MWKSVKETNNARANRILDLQQHRPKWRHHIMQRDGDDSRYRIAAQNISRADAKKGLETKKRSKPHEHAYRHPTCQGVGRVVQIQQFRNERPEIPSDFLQHAATLSRTLQPEKTENTILVGEPKIWTIVQIFGLGGLRVQC
jgi:hypothetical protein